MSNVVDLAAYRAARRILAPLDAETARASDLAASAASFGRGYRAAVTLSAALRRQGTPCGESEREALRCKALAAAFAARSAMAGSTLKQRRAR